MRKMFQYRIYPTKKQETKLNETLEECRWLYNHLLAKRKEVYEQDGLSIDRDLNAAWNILALGLQGIGIQSVAAPAFMHGK